MLEWVLEKTGTGRIYGKPRYSPRHSKAYEWYCFSWNARAILKQLIPFMMVKREKAENLVTELDAIEKAS